MLLPKAAPPNIPVLLPLTIGNNKSITFIPVSMISNSPITSLSGFNRSDVMSFLIGRVSVARTLPFMSIGWPVTFIILEKRPFPTGIVTGPPNGFAVWFFCKLSVEARAMQRAILPSRCSATSRISSLPSNVSVFRTSYSPGTSFASSNLTSTTGPWTAIILPVFLLLLSTISTFFFSQKLRSKCLAHASIDKAVFCPEIFIP